jgi:hypothetical protein
MPLWQGIYRLAGQVNRLLSPVCDRYPLLATLILALVVCVAVWLW